MGKALQVESGFITAPAAALTAVTPSGTDTFAVQYFDPGNHGWIIDAWADIDTAGVIRLRSPNMHDNVQGINLNVASRSPIPVLPADYKQPLVQNDTITVELADNGAGAPSAVSLLYYYDNLPGANASLYTWDEIRNQITQIMGCEVAFTPAGTEGQYEGSVGLNALQNQFKSEHNYALLGYETSVQYTTVGVTGPDTSNRRIAGPGVTPDIMDTRQWFVDLSKKSMLPTICVFNQQNINATVCDVIDAADNDNGNVRFIFGMLG